MEAWKRRIAAPISWRHPTAEEGAAPCACLTLSRSEWYMKRIGCDGFDVSSSVMRDCEEGLGRGG